MRHSRDQHVRRETVELAQRRGRAARALIGGSDLPAEEQVAILKVLCRRLWSLLDRRRGDGLTIMPEDLWGGMDEDSRAAVDRTCEAMMVLWSRDQVHVEPCRRITDHMLSQGFQYLLVPVAGGEQRVVDEATLLMMAGVA